MPKININTAFLKICDKLNLSQTLHKKLEDRYKAVSDYLNDQHELKDKDLTIYPQGSFAIGTTIKPFDREEYDLDFVCESKKERDPFKLFNLIKEALKDNGRYKGMIEEKKRCVRINYKGDFHLDILPACLDEKNSSSTGIVIPDKELKTPQSSDPKGFIAWFQGKFTNTRIDTGIEAIPSYQHTAQKNNLQHIVQLMKRHRDVFFQKKPADHVPPSIILTTLCGEYYESKETILDGMIHITDTIINKNIKEVYNPVNSKELLSEKWEENPELYTKFREWIQSLNNDLKDLQNREKLNENLSKMFGETIAKPVLDELEEREFIHKNRNNLGISSNGMLSVSSNNSFPSNTFYGDQEKDN